MSSEAPLWKCLPPEDDASADRILEGFLNYTTGLGLELYPHQEEAILALLADRNVILHTPTGSGKSLVATALHFKALAEGRRSFYTCPVKALVNEKFFSLCRELGADRVGMLTGDASVNRDAPIICCTAEVLANMALGSGEHADVDSVVMDEFHYFSDKERGVAWQIPLLTLPQARFLLMSATLGETEVFERTLTKLTSAETVTVRSALRPVPLRFEYREVLLHEAIHSLVEASRAPVYVVNFTQRACAEVAQNLLSVDYSSKEEKKLIQAELVGESFKSPYGKDVQKLLRHGVGLHHAGLLPRYRLLVEKLAQKGLLKVICGTDTLGVGVNVPIRSVLFTKLCKYDGDKVRILSVRDFHQIAGRAGRKGFDDEGFVVGLSPEHVAENRKLEAKARGDKAKSRKLVRKKPPEWGYVHWDAATFDKLRDSAPEPLISRFRVSYGMLLSVLGRPEGGCGAMKALVRDSLDAKGEKRRHGQYAMVLLRSLWEAGVIEFPPAAEGGGVRVNAELQRDFSLFHALSVYLIDAVERLDRESPDYALDVLSLIEAVVENPESILIKLLDKAKGEKVAELKAAGVEYDQRMEELEKLELVVPQRAFLEQSFAAFRDTHPWLNPEDLKPKCIAREMMANLHSFGGYVKEFGIARMEGSLLRYLTEVYKTLVQTVPDTARSELLDELRLNLGALVRGVDSSLLDEWERIGSGATGPRQAIESLDTVAASDDRALTTMTRNLLFSFLRAVASDDVESALDLVEREADGPTSNDLERWSRALLAEEGGIVLDARGRSPKNTQIEPGAEFWQVTQNILIGDEISEYFVRGRVDVARSRSERRAVFLLDQLG